MTPFVKRMNELLKVITESPERGERERAKREWDALILQLHRGGRRDRSDFKLAQAGRDE